MVARALGTVLVVDDNEDNRLVVRGPLEALGWLVDEAGNGAEAVDAVADGDYAAVLMDCEMPGMDGFAATAAMRAGGSRTWIIGLTAITHPAIRDRCLAAGMDDQLPKPATPIDLAAALAGLGRVTIDQGRLATLGCGRGGHSLVAELVDVFVRTIPGRIGALRDALELDDVEAVRFLAHNLRGTAANLGAEALRAVCTELEAAALQGQLADAAALVDELAFELDAARDALLMLSR